MTGNGEMERIMLVDSGKPKVSLLKLKASPSADGLSVVVSGKGLKPRRLRFASLSAAEVELPVAVCAAAKVAAGKLLGEFRAESAAKAVAGAAREPGTPQYQTAQELLEALVAVHQAHELFVCERCGRLAYMVDPGDGIVTHFTAKDGGVLESERE